MGAIYRIYFPASKKMYVGQTSLTGWEPCYEKRWSRAKWAAKHGKRARPLERAMLKYGVEGAQFRNLMTEVSERDIDGLERFFIAYFKSDLPEYGYNVQGGGKIKRPPLFSGGHVRNSDPRHVTTWYNRKYGEVVATTARISLLSGVDAGSLHKVRKGKTLSYRGWVNLDAPALCGVVYAPLVWKHHEHGIFTGSIAQFMAHWGKQRICRRLLSMVKLGKRPAHKGWTCLGRPTYEQEVAARLFFADQDYADPGHRNKKGPACTRPTDTLL